MKSRSPKGLLLNFLWKYILQECNAFETDNTDKLDNADCYHGSLIILQTITFVFLYFSWRWKHFRKIEIKELSSFGWWYRCSQEKLKEHFIFRCSVITSALTRAIPGMKCFCRGGVSHLLHLSQHISIYLSKDLHHMNIKIACISLLLHIVFLRCHKLYFSPWMVMEYESLSKKKCDRKHVK